MVFDWRAEHREEEETFMGMTAQVKKMNNSSSYTAFIFENDECVLR